MADLIGYGTYVPRHRLERSRSAPCWVAGRQGTRAVAGYDEDATSMAVEAGRVALQAVAGQWRRPRLLFATANPPYLDKTNANVVHAALQPGPDERWPSTWSARCARASVPWCWQQRRHGPDPGRAVRHPHRASGRSRRA